MQIVIYLRAVCRLEGTCGKHISKFMILSSRWGMLSGIVVLRRYVVNCRFLNALVPEFVNMLLLNFIF